MLPEGLAVQGVVLSDQIKSLDWFAREVERADRLDAVTLSEVIKKVSVLLADT